MGQWYSSTTRKKKSRGTLIVRCWRSWKCRDQRKEHKSGLLTMALPSLIGPSTIHTEHMGSLDGLWRGAEGCSGAKQKYADLWSNSFGNYS